MSGGVTRIFLDMQISMFVWEGTWEFCGVFHRNDVIFAAVKEESRTGDGFDVVLAVISLLGKELPKETNEFPCKWLHTGKGTDQHQSARLYFLHQL